MRVCIDEGKQKLRDYPPKNRLWNQVSNRCRSYIFTSTNIFDRIHLIIFVFMYSRSTDTNYVVHQSCKDTVYTRRHKNKIVRMCKTVS